MTSRPSGTSLGQGGDPQATQALWEVLDEDGLLNRILWVRGGGVERRKRCDLPAGDGMNADRLTPIKPDGQIAKVELLAGHTALDMANYRITYRYKAGSEPSPRLELRIKGAHRITPMPTQTVIDLCRLTRPRAKHCIKERWGIDL